MCRRNLRHDEDLVSTTPPMRRSLPVTLVLALVFGIACASHVKKADDFAKHGDWERAMAEYRSASAARPQDQDLIDKKNRAEREVDALWTKRGLDAQAAGKLGEAGEWWRRAIELRPTGSGAKSARGVATANAAALEQFGDQALSEKRFQDAFLAWGPLLLLHPERIDLSNKNADAHRLFAGELDAQADALSKKNLPGAALVADLRALQNDPMHPSAYQHSAELRKSILAHSAVAIPAVTVDDGGWNGLANVIAPKLNARLGEFPPYGPTKSASAIPATFNVTVLEFAWWDSSEHVLEAHAVKAGSGSGPVPNPKRAAQNKLIASLEGELKRMQSGAAMGGGSASPWITPVPVKTPAPVATPAMPAKGAKSVATPAPVARERKPMSARPADEDDITRKQVQLEKAQKDLAAIPETVDASQSNTWYLPVTQTTRLVRVRIRFEVREPDFETPITKEQEFRFEAQDRSNDADNEHGVAADPVKLPPLEQMVTSVAEKVGDGLVVLKDARARRADRLVEQGRQRHAAGNDDEALDAWVQAMFILGAAGLPEDANKLVVSRLDGVDPKSILTP